MFKKSLVGVSVLLAFGMIAVLVAAQQSPPPPGQGQGQGRWGMGGPPPVLGTITSVGVDRFEIKKTDGTVQTVMINDQTRFRQRTGFGEPPQELALEDLKVGDHVMARGSTNSDKQLLGQFVNRLTAEQFERFQNMGGPGGPRGGGNWGPGGGGGMGPGGSGPRAFGEITSIEGNTIKLHSRRGDRVIVVNDKTTFNKEGQAATLKDFKVGDRIFALGTEADGKFTATEVHGGRRGGFGGPGGGGPGGGPGGGGGQGPPQN